MYRSTQPLLAIISLIFLKGIVWYHLEKRVR
jgi:hypothetical protein